MNRFLALSMLLVFAALPTRAAAQTGDKCESLRALVDTTRSQFGRDVRRATEVVGRLRHEARGPRDEVHLLNERLEHSRRELVDAKSAADSANVQRKLEYLEKQKQRLTAEAPERVRTAEALLPRALKELELAEKQLATALEEPLKMLKKCETGVH